MIERPDGVTFIENAVVITGKRHRQDKDFIKLYRLFSEKCLQDFGALNGELKLLVYMMTELQSLPMNTEGWMDLDTEVVIKMLATSKQTYFVYLKKLRENRYIEQKRAKTTIWRINPEYCYRGDLVESKKQGKVTAVTRKPRTAKAVAEN